jgi:DDE superfamily endonuclease
VYRAVDQFGQVIDVFVSAQRDGTAARRFFEHAICTTKTIPMEVVTDLAPVYAATLEELLPAAWHRTDRYGNNRLEADHGRLKARLRPMRGLKQDRSARVVIAGHGFMQNLRRGHYELAVEEPGDSALGGRVRRACLGDLTPDRAATSRCRRLIRCNSAPMAATAPLYARPKSSERALHQSKLLAAAYALKLLLTRETYTEKPEGWSPRARGGGAGNRLHRVPAVRRRTEVRRGSAEGFPPGSGPRLARGVTMASSPADRPSAATRPPRRPAAAPDGAARSTPVRSRPRRARAGSAEPRPGREAGRGRFRVLTNGRRS